jgi:hypothetical protein
VLPEFAPIRQYVSTEQIENVEETVRAGLQRLLLASRIKPGMSVAIGLGSRGIVCLPKILRVLLDELNHLGARPFLVPAMGSHGGGTPHGQRQVLESYGFVPPEFDLPIISAPETLKLGLTPSGMPVYFDAQAARADAIFWINRIKEHTAFKGSWESGLCKMLAVGFGKAHSAETLHAYGLKAGIPEAAQFAIGHLPLVAGIAIVENGRHQPAHISVIPAENVLEEEPKLLELARRMIPKIPFEPLDLLVVQKMGKDISGTGMDLNVIGMWRRTGGEVSPRIKVIAVLDLTETTHGNATGIGHADLIPRRLYEKIDLSATYKNCLTAQNLAGAKIPMTMENDQEVLKTGLLGAEPETARVVLVQDTLNLETLWVSSALLREISNRADLEILGPARPLVFTETGQLILEGTL